MPAASSDDARGASSAASVLAPSEGETEDPRISAYVAHLAHVGDEMAAGLGALFADAFPEVPSLADIHEGFTFSKNDSLLLFAGLDGNALTLAQRLSATPSAYPCQPSAAKVVGVLNLVSRRTDTSIISARRRLLAVASSTG